MKRQPLIHDRVFDKPDFAAEYARKHEGMERKLGKVVVGRDLISRGFKGGRILDNGCGPGFMLLELLKLFPNSQGIGIDLAEPLLEVGRKISETEGLADRVKFEAADVESLPYPNNHFDCVVSTNMLHIVANPIKQLNEIERVLKRGGLFYIADLKRAWWVSLFEKVAKTAFTIKEAGELIAQSKLRKGELGGSFVWWVYKG
jgi:ubiquinone/menaquinone biosynthesis C-methylase UbiE